MSTDPTPTDDERYPTLSEHGRDMLRFLREHPHAPIFRNQSGNRLLAEDVERVREFERETQAARFDWSATRRPDWLESFVRDCYREVPHYRSLGSPPLELGDVPTVTRADLSRDIARFVPDSAPVERMINFKTSGTTGHPLLLASHPIVAASYLAFHKRALGRFGIRLQYGRGQVGVVLIGWQKTCFTYVSVTPTQDESGLAKINLHPDDWRDPADRAKYFDALAPEVVAGDPISFAVLAELPTQHRPRALLSTSMSLSAGMKSELEGRFGCPLLDLYSMNEAGPVAVFDTEAGGHVLLQPRMFVEILDAEGAPLPPGGRGEVVLTGGFNFCLPLLRYRTGDHAALVFDRDEPVLVGLEGRPPVRFRNAAGAWLNNIEVTHALARFAIPQYALHQSADGALTLRLSRRLADRDEVVAALSALFGEPCPLRVEEDVPFDGKVVQYTSDLDGARP
jgi:phenylacetate-CoA ligase